MYVMIESMDVYGFQDVRTINRKRACFIKAQKIWLRIEIFGRTTVASFQSAYIREIFILRSLLQMFCIIYKVHCKIYSRLPKVSHLVLYTCTRWNSNHLPGSLTSIMSSNMTYSTLNWFFKFHESLFWGNYYWTLAVQEHVSWNTWDGLGSLT